MKVPEMLNAKTVLVSTLALLIVTGSATAQRRTPPVVQEERAQIDVESYTVEVALTPAERLLRGVAVLTVRQLERSSFVTFDLDSRLRVDKVLIDGIEARFRQYDLDGTVEVSPSGGAASNTSTYHFEYEGFLDPPRNRRASAASSISDEGAYLLYESKWFPTNQLYKDKASAAIKVRVPGDWTVVSDLPGSGDHFASTTPSYWGLIAAGKYSTSTVKTDRGEVSIHTLQAKSEDAKLLVEAAGEVLDFYAATFGPPIQPKFHIIEAADANFPSRWGVGTLLMSGGQFRPDFDQPALAIALAHQWFPLKFAVEDAARDAWLADGFATFASLLYAEKNLPPAGAQEQIDKALVKALANEDQISVVEAGSLDRESSEYRALVHYKGAYIFRMLRWVIGEEKFNEFLTRYAERFQNAPASTDAVKKLASDVYGDELGYFFDQWLVDTGVPEMTADTRTLRVKDGYRVEGEIRQDLDLFRMPVEIEIETDSEPEYRRVDVSRQASEFTVDVERKPKAINIDPRKQILRLSPDIRVAVHINRGEEFMNDGRFNDALDQFQDAIDLNPNSSLASFRMGEALLEIGNTTQAAQNFRNALIGDLKPKWVEVWSYINLGKVYDSRGDHERAISEYQRAINTGDDAYGAQAEAEKYIKTPFRPGGQRR